MKTAFSLSSIIIILLLFGSCKDKNDDTSIKLDDIRPKAESRTQSKNDKELDSLKILLKSYENDSFNLRISKLQILKEPTFLSRFPNEENGIRSLTCNDTTIKLTHEFYLYKDSIQMKNAFFNWLDCNGKECKSIKLYDECKFEPTNLLVISSGNSIDIIRSDKEIKTIDWVSYVRLSRKNKELKFIIYQKKNQKAKWLEFKNYKLVQKLKK
jgi:hypothetical protein